MSMTDLNRLAWRKSGKDGSLALRLGSVTVKRSANGKWSAAIALTPKTTIRATDCATIGLALADVAKELRDLYHEIGNTGNLLAAMLEHVKAAGYE